MYNRDTDSAAALFGQVWQAVRQDRFYQPRPYQTIGGMWTADTWKRDSITAQLMDEGYTQRIIAPGLDVVLSGNGSVVFATGNASRLADLQRIEDLL